jgi:phosphoribosylformylglycinamidine cyclo-ligase
MGKLVLSPTRTYLPLMHMIFSQIEQSKLHGIIHNTGGGQTKCMNFVTNLHVIKDNLFTTPLLFQLIQEESKASWKEMYKVFNMGSLLEIYTDEVSAKAMIEMAQSLGIQAQIVGRCEAAEKNQLTIHGKDGLITY